MAAYILIASRDHYEAADAPAFFHLAASLARAEDKVTVFLVQNAVLPARAGAEAPHLAELAAAGVEILADDFSLRERGISADRLATGVRAVAIDVVIDHLAEGRKALWQ